MCSQAESSPARVLPCQLPGGTVSLDRRLEESLWAADRRSLHLSQPEVRGLSPGN